MTDEKQMVAAAIDDAEEIANPLDGLVDRAAADPGAPFEPEMLERLCELKREDPATHQH